MCREAIEVEDDAGQEQEVVVAGHHVLGAEVQQRPNRETVDRLEQPCISFGDAVCLSGIGRYDACQHRQDDASQQDSHRLAAPPIERRRLARQVPAARPPPWPRAAAGPMRYGISPRP